MLALGWIYPATGLHHVRFFVVVQVRRQSSQPADGAERRFLLEGVPWPAYVALRDGLEDAGVRMTYLEGRLELISPSEKHEEEKKLIARLLETWPTNAMSTSGVR